MIKLIDGSEWAYNWGYKIGDREIMRPKVTECEWVYWWIRNIGDKDTMLGRINDPCIAHRLIQRIGPTPELVSKLDGVWLKEFQSRPENASV